MFNQQIYDIEIKTFEEITEELIKKSYEMYELSAKTNDIVEKCILVNKANKYMELNNYIKNQEIEYLNITKESLEKENTELRKTVENNEQNG